MIYSYKRINYISYEENNIDTVVLSMWSHILSSDESNLAKANRGFDKRMQYVTIDDIVDAGMSIKDLIEPTITSLLYSSDNPHGGFMADNKQSLSESIERSEAAIANNGGELVTYKLYKKGVSYDGLCKIQELCKQKGKTLILLTTPSYRGDRYQDHDHFKQNLRDSLGGSGLIYVDFDNFPLPDSCYKDALHTNRHGAKIFSEHINKYGLLYGAAEVIRLE